MFLRRTVFHFGHELAQVVLREPRTVLLTETAISDLDTSAFQSYFAQAEAGRISRDINTNLSQQAPVRLSVYTPKSSAARFLVLSIHHALYDGISLAVLLRNLECIYLQQPQIPSASLRAVLDPVSSLDQKKARKFWQRCLKGFDWSRMLNRTASTSYAEVASVSFKTTLSELQTNASKRQVTLQALLMSAYGSLLASRVYQHNDVVFGVRQQSQV